MTDHMICQNQDNHLLYALKHGRFWFWDKRQNKWVPSDFAAQQYAKAQTKEPDLAQEDWLGRCFGILMDDYEVPDAVVKALRALPNKEEPPCKVNTTAPNADAAVTMAAPAATLAEETSTTQADANSCPPDPCFPAGTSAAMSNPSGAETACSAPAFDYSGLDEQTVNDLQLAERECAAGRRLAEAGLHRMADGVAIAHEALVPNWDKRNNQYSEDTFRRWCESIGVSKSAAYRLLQVTALFDNSSPEQQKILDSLSPSLLYAAAKPTAPAPKPAPVPVPAAPAAPPAVPAGISASDLQAQGVPTALAQLMAANNVTPEELQTVVGQRGYFPADMPVKDYPADFVSGCLVAAWPQVLEMICTNRDVPF